MTIEQKINLLESYLAKAEDVEYSINVNWGHDIEKTKNELRVLVTNARTFLTRKDFLEYPERESGLTYYSGLLDEALARFPEIQVEKQKEEQLKFN